MRNSTEGGGGYGLSVDPEVDLMSMNKGKEKVKGWCDLIRESWRVCSLKNKSMILVPRSWNVMYVWGIPH